MMAQLEILGLIGQGIKVWTDLGIQQMVEGAVPFAKSLVGLFRQGGFEALRQVWSEEKQEGSKRER